MDEYLEIHLKAEAIAKLLDGTPLWIAEQALSTVSTYLSQGIIDTKNIELGINLHDSFHREFGAEAYREKFGRDYLSPTSENLDKMIP